MVHSQPDVEIKYDDYTYLIIDDSRDMRKVMRKMLHLLGISSIEESYDGASALKILKSNNIDFVICDWNMPGLSGIELLEIVRNMPEYRTLPFLLTGHAESAEERIAQAAETGVDGYLIKPFVAKTLEEKIIEIFKNRLEPSEEQLAIEHALKLADQKKYDQALDCLMDIHSKKPNSASIMHIIGTIYELKENSTLCKVEKEKIYNEIEKWYKKAEQANPKYIKVHQSLGDFYEKKGEINKALESYERAADINPNNPTRMVRIGEISLETGSLKKANKAFQQLSHIQSTKRADSLRDVGELYLKHGHPEKAEEVFLESIREKRDPYIYNRLGIALRKQGKSFEAIKFYKRGISLDPDNEAIFFNVGMAFLELGKEKEAKQAFHKALLIDPDFEEAKKEISKL